MERRDFLKKAGAVAATGAAVSTIASPAIAADKKQIKMVTTWPKNFPGLGTGAQRVADRITAMSDGRITVKLFAANELVPPFQSFDAVSSGAAELYHGAEYYWQGKHKGYNFFAAVPLGLTAQEIQAWVHFGGGQQLWDEMGKQFGVKGFLAGNTGVQMGGWFRKPITKLDDMKGLKMRMPGLGGEVLRRLGAAAVALPGGEIFPSLQSGAIDATEWVGPYNDRAFGFYKVLKNYMYPGFHEPGTALSTGVNLKFWESLSKSDQALIAGACSAENDIMTAEFNARNGEALRDLIDNQGVKLHAFPEDVWKAIADASEQVTSEVASGDAIGKKIYESFAKFRKDVAGWTALSDSSYTDYRKKAIGI